MSLNHKAFEFRHSAFEKELAPILFTALKTGVVAPLVQFVHQNLAACTDPYEGDPLVEDWEAQLSAKDVQEYGDFALTKYYRPADCVGISTEWMEIDASLAEPQRKALLGAPFGPDSRLFDPGLMGSYFQDADEVKASRHALRAVGFPAVEYYKSLLDRAAANGNGVYVTF